MYAKSGRRMKQVAVIGAGASGLTAIKCCLDEGLEPVCFERTDDIGGLWKFRTDTPDGQACVMKSTVINTSKEMMCYSDFPIPKEYPIFMHNTYVQKYFRLYADKFNLEKHIRFETQVEKVKPRPDFDQSGQWDICIRDNKTGTTENLVFDAVLVCTGHHANIHQPIFHGQDRFKGQVIHTHDYKDHRGYEDKRVVIIGIGNSAGDCAVELSRIASQVYLSTRRGSWVINRVSDGGLPVDISNINRFMIGLKNRFLAPANKYVEYHLNKRFNHNMYSLEPAHKPFAQHPMINDDLPNRIICGSVIVKPDVEEFTETGVKFVDGTTADDIDVVLLATGYVFGFPFLDKSVLEVQKNEVNLFKYMFPPDLTSPTLAVIGCVQPLGSLMPISEMQCRLATRVFKRDVILPSRDDMWADTRKKKKEMTEQYVKSQRHTIQVDYIAIMDELAELNGCSPDIKSMIMKDPVLAFYCVFRSCTPYQYRLNGPGAWPEARVAIMSQWDRTLYPLKTRPMGDLDKASSLTVYLVWAAVLVLLAYLFGFLS